MIINHNMKSINAHRMMGVNASGMGKSIEKLSSGLRINRAADDAAGLAISEKMRSQIRGMQQASRNAQDGISVVQTAEGALDEVHSMLQRMKQLAVQSANDSNQSLVDREALQLEVDQLTEEIDSITKKTQFNKMTLLDGTFQDKKFHVGANQDETIDVSIKSMTARGLGLKVGGEQILSETAGKTRTLAAKGNYSYGQAAKGMAQNKEIQLSAFAFDAKETVTDKAIFRIELNGVQKDVEVDLTAVVGQGNKLEAGKVATALTAEFNKILKDKYGVAAAKFAVDDTTKIKFTGTEADFPAESEITGANFKVSFINQSDFKLAAHIDAVSVAANDATGLTEVASKLDISHEVGTYGNFEITIDGKKAVTVNLTEADNDKTKIEAKLKAALGDSVKTASFDLTKGIITIETNSKGKGSSIDVLAANESSRKTVNYKGVNILNRDEANASINNIQSAIEELASRRAYLGAKQNRIEHTIKNLDNSAENLQAAESRVRDVDMADEMSKFTRANILTQASQAMLAQANQLPQQVLQLLR